MSRYNPIRVWMIIAVVVLASMAISQRSHAQSYRTLIQDARIVDVHGETADTAKLGNDRYVEDNLDHLLANNEWLAVNFSTYWCPDSRAYTPQYDSMAALPRYDGIRWAYADIDGTAGNEDFRKRFDLPGIPVTILFHNGEIIESDDGTKSILDGHLGDKNANDLLALLNQFYKPEPGKK